MTRPAFSRPGRHYAELDPATQAVVRLLTAEERLTWDDEATPCVDVTAHRPRPRVGQVWNGRRFTAPGAGTEAPVHPDPVVLIGRRRDLIALAQLIRTYCNALAAGTYTTKTPAQTRDDLIDILRNLP